MAENIIVTSALPYANGPIHFGHIVGAYLPADIHVRFRRMRGDHVHFVCGTDEHGVAITLRAEQAGVPYDQYVDGWHQEIRRSLDAVGIEFDIFSGTAEHRNPHHRPLAQQFFRDLVGNDYVTERTEAQFFSEKLGRFLPDRYIEGTCYVCDYDKARGDECPSCGTWLDAKRLRNPICSLDGLAPILRDSRHWYLKLDQIRDEWLAAWFESKTWKPNVANFVRPALAELRDRPITRDLPWGVPVPLPDTDGKVLYVWFEAPIGYLSISQQYWTARGEPERFEQLWKDPNTKLLHFLGKDNITFHTVVFPAMLYGTKAGWIVPDNVPANEFFNLEGRKFNTSAGWFIPPSSLEGFSSDQIRYALTTMMPETADSDFSWREFQSRLNDDLADNLGNFVARTLRFAERYLGGVLPALAEPDDADRAILAEATLAGNEMAEHFLSYSFRKAAARLMTFGNACNRYYDQQQPWVTRTADPHRCGQTLRVCSELIRSLGLLLTPIMPSTGARILEALHVRDHRWQSVGGVGLAEGPLHPAPMPVLFPKVDGAKIDAEADKLAQLAQARPGAAPQSVDGAGDGSAGTATRAALADPIEFEQFSAVDLRVGTIIEAASHPKADRLLVLQVDLGFEQRTIVAGVAESYRPEELVGTQVIVVANLTPRKLRGIESKGMIAAANDAQGKPRFIQPAPDTPNGTRVS